MWNYYVITHGKHCITQTKFDEYVIYQLLFNMLNSRFFFPQNLVILVHFFHKSFTWVRLDFFWWPRDENFTPKKPLYKSHWFSFGHQVVKIFTSKKNIHWLNYHCVVLCSIWTLIIFKYPCKIGLLQVPQIIEVLEVTIFIKKCWRSKWFMVHPQGFRSALWGWVLLS